MIALNILYNLVPGADKVNFPVMFSDLCGTIPDSFWGTVTDPNGLDIRFYSDINKTVELKREIEYFNQSLKKLRAWIQIPLLKGSLTGENTVIYCEAGVGTLSNSTEIWSDIGGLTIQHFNDNLNDSVAISNDPVPNNSPVYVDNPIGGRGIQFDGTNHLTYPNNIDFIFGDNLYVEAWIKTNVETGYSSVYERTSGCKNTYRKQIMFSIITATNYLGDNNVGVYIENATSCSTSASNTHHIAYYTNPNVYSVGNWIHVSVISLGYPTYPRALQIYVNGNPVTTNVNFNSVSIPDAKVWPLQETTMGAQYAPLDGDPTWYKWFHTGEVSEIRTFCSTTPFPFDDDWVATNYNTQTNPSSFMTITEGSAGGSVVIYRRRRKINTSI